MTGTRAEQRVMNLAQLVTIAARTYPNRLALAWGTVQLTWEQFSERVDAFAVALVEEFGVRKGDRILVQSQNCNQMFEAMFACFRVGAIWVPMNFRQTPGEVVDEANTAGASLMICNSRFSEHADECRRQVDSITAVIGIGGGDFGPSYEVLVEKWRGRSIADVAVLYDDPCWLLFTSGTTGKPKPAMMTHGQLAFVINNHLADVIPGTTALDAALVLAPLSHGAGIHQLLLVARGGLTVLMPSEKLDIDQAWQLVDRWKVTSMFTVPTILKLMVEHSSVEMHDHSSLRYVVYAGAPMYREDQKLALAVLGPVLVQYYGLVEVTGNITVLPSTLHSADDTLMRVGTCGLPRTAMQVQVRLPDGGDAGPNETGEICVIGPAVFAGYYENPQATAKAFRDGWFYTGDMGHFDSDGFLYITGRASDMYISGGSNIYPREIEDAILIHPEIEQAAVVGMPDPVWGEIGVAVCVLIAGSKLNEADVSRHLEGLIARYKVPKKVLFWDELPMSGYGKVTKALLKKELARRNAGEIAA